ncbi:hypothetical protein [Terribacillus saccharophilus]|nr:hypothetical protein [Terribacillus saccharophilus]
MLKLKSLLGVLLLLVFCISCSNSESSTLPKNDEDNVKATIEDRLNKLYIEDTTYAGIYNDQAEKVTVVNTYYGQQISDYFGIKLMNNEKVNNLFISKLEENFISQEPSRGLYNEEKIVQYLYIHNINLDDTLKEKLINSLNNHFYKIHEEEVPEQYRDEETTSIKEQYKMQIYYRNIKIRKMLGEDNLPADMKEIVLKNYDQNLKELSEYEFTTIQATYYFYMLKDILGISISDKERDETIDTLNTLRTEDGGYTDSSENDKSNGNVFATSLAVELLNKINSELLSKEANDIEEYVKSNMPTNVNYDLSLVSELVHIQNILER